ncbi:hypothetical protein CHS0354_027893 [Potamilus streckersoni]|uniref:Polypeptide N-acetylgalactosaminyltransferase n=1 Tax=Potamilus streckersoni TaxID=2493646 RepID=A0AAE0T4B4_9BIVA|nr:hypothetical protein CHS0354_027893 [Potamilus streckersoni]
MRLVRRYTLILFGLAVLIAIVIFITLIRILAKYGAQNKLRFQKQEILKNDIFSQNRKDTAVFYTGKDTILFNGQAVNVRLMDTKKAEIILDSPMAKELEKQHEINVILSDLLPINRRIPDSRPTGCKSLTYPTDLPTTSIVIPFYNEWPSILLRTVCSILDRTPSHLLKEIILVDDASDMQTLKKEFEQKIKELASPIVKMIRLPYRQGLIRARLEGFKQVTGQVVSFFDSHMEVNVNWLEPLLFEIQKDRKTVPMAQLDYINRGNFVYEFEAGYRTKYGFDWRLVFFETYFSAIQLKEKSDTDPLPGVVMVGPAFVVDVQYFKELGTYDSGMKIWGGENLEFPWRVWMCGGRLIHVPCSRVGHIARPQPYDFPDGRSETEAYNYKRAIEVWMDEYKTYVYNIFPSMRAVNAGDLSERFDKKAKLKCKSFRWYLQNVWPDLLPYQENVLFWGYVINKKMRYCLDNEEYLFTVQKELKAFPCSGSINRQTFALTSTLQLRTNLQCIVVKGYLEKTPFMEGCFQNKKENWQHSKDGLLRHMNSGLCLEIREDKLLFMNLCDHKNHLQLWTFQHSGS